MCGAVLAILLMIVNPQGGGGLAAINVSAGTTSNAVSALTFGNAGGITFGLAGSVVTAAAPAGVPSPVNFSAGLASANLGSVVFADSNNIHFGLAGSTVTAIADVTGGFSGIIVGTDTVTVGTGGLVSFHAAGALTIAELVAGDPSAIEFGVDNSIGLTVAQTNVTWTVNTAGISFDAGGYAGVGETVGTVAGTDLALTVNTAGVSIAYPKWITTAAAAVPIGTAVKAVASVGSTGTITRYAPEDHQHAGVAAFAVSNTGNTLGNTRSQVGTLFLAASGGITASQSTAAAGNDTVWFSVATPVPIGTAVKAVASVGSTGTITRYAPEDHQHAGVAAFAVTNTGNTLGNTRSQVGTLYVAASGAITASQSTAAAGNDTVWLSVDAQSVQTQNLAVVIVSGTNGNATFSSGTYSIKAGANITLSTGANVVTIIGATAAGDGGIFAGAAGTTQTAGTVVWSNSNNVSFGMNGSTITATVTVAQSNQSVGLYATGNTTNNSSTTLDARTLGTWNALGAMTVGFSNGSVQISAPATSVLTGVDPIAISTNGSTISVQMKSELEFCPYSQIDLVTNSTLGQSSLYFVPFDVDGVVSGSRLNLFVSLTHTYSGAPANSTAWWALGYGLYTRMTGTGSDRISLLTSYSLSVVSINVSSNTRLSATHYVGLSNATSHTTSQYGQNNVSVTDYLANSLGGYRVVAMPLNAVLTAGRYWLGVSGQSSNQGVSAILSASIMQQILGNNIAFRPFGTSSAASNASFYTPQLAGSYSAQSAAWPATIPLTTDALRAAPACVIPYFNISGIGTSTNLL